MKCVILGGGISGLSVAHYIKAAKINTSVLLLEASNKLGGYIESSLTPNDGLFMNGPRTIRADSSAAEDVIKLVEAMKLENILVPYKRTTQEISTRYIKINSKLVVLPLQASILFKAIPPFTKPLLPTMIKEMFIAKCKEEDESIYSFYERRFNREIAEFVIDPMIKGICAGDSREISVKAMHPVFYEYEQKYGSVLSALFKKIKITRNVSGVEPDSELVAKSLAEKWSAFTFFGGISSLINAMGDKCIKDGIKINLNSLVVDIVKDGDGLIVKTAQDSYPADFVISALPASCANKLVTNLCPTLAHKLNEIPYASVALVNLEFDGELIEKPAFGYLVPSNQKDKVLGVIFDSCLYPISKTTLLTVMMGGLTFKQHYGNNPSKDALLKGALEELATTLNITKEPINFRVTILEDCIPQYTLGHNERIASCYNIIKKEKLPLLLSGNSYHGVSVTDTVSNAKKVVERLKYVTSSG